MVLAMMALDDPSQFEGTDPAVVTESPGPRSRCHASAEKLHGAEAGTDAHGLARASDFLPWTALLLGIWIPNFYYWGLNQYIMQRTLGASSLAEGQRGIVFAAS